MMDALHKGTTGPEDDGWQGVLDDDESILWQGRPDGRFVFKPLMLFTTTFGIVFSSIALFWMIGVSRGGSLFWVFGLLHFGAGLTLIFGGLFTASFVRQRTWYTLTDKRAFIAKNLPFLGRSIRSYPINSRTVIEYHDGRFSNVFFANEKHSGTDGAHNVPIGFERITDGKSVLQLIRGIQKDAK